jgi:membrane fusion protein (multidrug efflux system)
MKNRWMMVVPALALAAGCGGEEGAGGGGGPGGMPPMPVETAAVQASGMTDRFNVVGSLASDAEIVLVSEISALVVELPFREGEELAKGDLIARLDDAQALAEVQRAEALVQQRRTAFERIQAIVRENAGAPQDLDDAAANLAVAEADLALAQTRLQKTRIVAPFAGVFGARDVSVGTYLTAGERITQRAQLDRLRVNFSAPELYVGRLHVGAPVEVRTSAYPDLVLEGTVDVVSPVLDRASRSARIVAHVDNQGRRLRPGMSAEISVVLASRPGALTVPGEAVFFQGQQAFVYTVGDDAAVALAPVSLGTRGAELVEITSGLEAGQTVVRTGHQKLFPGAKVMPVGDEGAPNEGEAPEDQAPAGATS